MMKYLIRICLVFLLMILSCQHKEKSIKNIYDLHVQSIQNRDLDLFLNTITENKTFHYLSTTGEKITSREEYYGLHREWFKKSGWIITFELKEIYQAENFGYAMSLFTYEDETKDGKKISITSYVTFIFQLENGEWKIIADVCTPIKRD